MPAGRKTRLSPMLSLLLNVITPVMCCIAIGYLWGRQGASFDMEFITRLITYIGAPALIVATMNSTDLHWDAFTYMATLTLLLLAGFLVVGVILLKVLRMKVTDFALAVLMPNTGNMGLSLCLFAFGDEGLALGMIVFVVASLIHFASGDILLSHEKSMGSRLMMVARQPLVLAAVLSIALVASGWKLPATIASTVQLLGGMTIPLMLITLGVSLARLGASDWWGGARIAAARLITGLAVSLGLVWLLKVPGLFASILVLQAVMPSAVFNYLFALKHDRQPAVVASGVVISTCLSLIVIPVVLWVLFNYPPEQGSWAP